MRWQCRPTRNLYLNCIAVYFLCAMHLCMCYIIGLKLIDFVFIDYWLKHSQALFLLHLFLLKRESSQSLSPLKAFSVQCSNHRSFVRHWTASLCSLCKPWKWNKCCKDILVTNTDEINADADSLCNITLYKPINKRHHRFSFYNPPREAQASGVWKEIAKKVHNGSENSENKKKYRVV